MDRSFGEHTLKNRLRSDFAQSRETCRRPRSPRARDDARFLGEIALVGCLGALRRGEDLTAQELDELGFNRSVVHVDVPFGTSEVDVVATVSRRGEVPLLEKGLWWDHPHP